MKKIRQQGSRESITDLYNKLNTGQLSLEDLSKEDN
jgi:hypothetical protein